MHKGTVYIPCLLFAQWLCVCTLKDWSFYIWKLLQVQWWLITRIRRWVEGAQRLTLRRNVGQWFEKQEREEMRYSSLPWCLSGLKKCWSMERNTRVRRSFLWGVIFWEGRRVLIQAAVAEPQRVSSQSIRHLFLMGLEVGSLKLQYWLGPGLLPFRRMATFLVYLAEQRGIKEEIFCIFL